MDVLPLATRRAAPRQSIHRACSLLGAVGVLGALIVIWATRLTLPGTVYVSELGSIAAPTAAAFNAALLVLAAGGMLTGIGSLGAGRAPGLLGAWAVSASLVAAGGAFAVAAWVPCTAGCPVPFTQGSTDQDLLHVAAAVVGFGAATWAMLQVSWGGRGPALRIVSRIAAVAVGVIASVGGILSVLRFRTDIGGNLEFVAMSIAVLWLVAYAVTGAISPRSR